MNKKNQINIAKQKALNLFDAQHFLTLMQLPFYQEKLPS